MIKKVLGKTKLSGDRLHLAVVKEIRNLKMLRYKTEVGGCFIAGTLVHTKDGLKPIENVAIGDWVLSYPEDKLPPDHFREEHEYTYRQVKQVFVTENQPVSKLIVSNLATGERETIFVTGNHPVFCKNHGWIPVSSMRAGYVVENFRYRNLLVFRVYHDVENSRVYNLEVDDFHTYYVGEQGIWVHNKCEVESTKTRRVQ